MIYIHKGLTFRGDQDIVPKSLYDATNKEDECDSLTLSGGLHQMMGAAVTFFCCKNKHVGIGGSTNCEYMALERNTRTSCGCRIYFAVLRFSELKAR